MARQYPGCENQRGRDMVERVRNRNTYPRGVQPQALDTRRGCRTNTECEVRGWPPMLCSSTQTQNQTLYALLTYTERDLRSTTQPLLKRVTEINPVVAVILPPFYSIVNLHNDQRLSCLSKLFSAISIMFYLPLLSI